MSCQLKTVAKIDVECVIKYSPWKTVQDRAEKDRIEDSSGTDSAYEASVELPFLNYCQISLSPSGEVLALAQHDSVIILAAKWDSLEEDEVKTKYKILWQNDLRHGDHEKITAVLCLPLILQGKTSNSAHSTEQCSLDWTCIAVGFSTGHLRFYDEAGGLLLSEQIHDEPVTSLKCQSYHPSRTSSYDDFPEELYVTFRTVVASIPGFALFQTLRACRNQLARVQANCAEAVVPPPLSLKKWAFTEQEKVRDCEIIGPASSDTFDHLLTASLCGGFKACYRAGAPKSTLLVAAGKGPFVGFHYALEGVEARSVLTDVALAVTSKFRGWLRGNKGSSDRQKESVVIDRAEPMGCRFGISDYTRQAELIVRSPNREYSVVCDQLGRVTLVDNARGVVLRMWKGYRKAQCGWLQVEEEEPSGKSKRGHSLRTVLFLVIYDPKKGVIEVWPAPQGPRIAAFSCSKKGKLLYTSHGLVGLNNVAVKWANKSISPCVFLHPNGTLSEIVVPFHCALSDETSERAADLCLLRKLKVFLRESEADSETIAQEVGLTAAELRTTDVRSQCLAMLISNKHVTPDALEAALVVFMDRVTSKEPRHIENSENTLLISSQQLRNLTTLFRFVQQQREKPPGYASVVPQQEGSDIQAVSSTLSASKRELTGLRSLLSLIKSLESCNNTPRKEARVTFQRGLCKKSAFVDFLSCFDIGKLPSILSKNDLTSSRPIVSLNKKTSTEKLKSLAELLFQGILYSEVPIADWREEAANSSILGTCLLQLAVQFWLSRNLGHAVEVEMMRFADIVKVICTLEGTDCREVSALWGSVRVMLIESDRPFNALTASIVCRSVSIAIEKQDCGKVLPKNPFSNPVSSSQAQKADDVGQAVDVVKDGSDKKELYLQKNSNEGEWENVSWNSAQWSLLIGRLEDVALLEAVVSKDPGESYNEMDKSVMPRIPFTKPVISFGNILRKGKGAISEVVAKWLVSSGLDPKLLTESTDVEWTERVSRSLNDSKQMGNDDPPPEDKSDKEDVREGTPLVTEQGAEVECEGGANAQTIESVWLLKKHFPYSLSGTGLLANLCWEFILLWHKTPDRMDILDGALLCLQTVPCAFVRQGLCCLLWSSYLKQRFETAIQLLNLSHGNPKEKHCRKELEMSELQLAHFFDSCVKFLDAFIEASNMSEVTHPPGPDSAVKRSEDLWDYELQGVEGVVSAPALTILALQQPQVQFEHLDLLLRLAICSHMILALNIRTQQLTPLFSRTEWAIFFSDFSPSRQWVKSEPEAHLTSSRTQFLMRAISAAMQNVLATDPCQLTDLSGGLRADMSTAMHWMGQCQELAHTWHMSVDPLRRHQVCLLYSAGHDRLAEEILPAVNELDHLASQLILIVGQRVKLLLDNSENLTEKISNLDPKLTSWLFELNTEGVRKVPLPDTAQLTTHIVQHLSEEHPENWLALELFDAVQALLTVGDC